MKFLSISLMTASLVFLASCGGQQAGKTYTDDLAGWQQKLNDKRAELAALQQEVLEIEAKVNQLDPNAVGKNALVTTMIVPKINFAHYVDIQGNVTTYDPAMASSETGGRIQKLLVEEGATVGKGQLIATIDLEALNKSLAELEKRMELAREVYQRQENLWKQNIGSEIQYLQAKNNVEALEQTKATLQYQMTKANVYAPISGVVEKIYTKAGEICGPGTPILTIFNLNNLKVKAEVPENYVRSVRKGERVRLSFPSLNQEIDATITDIGRMINPANRTFAIEVLLNNAQGIYKPNMLVNVMVKDQEEANVPVIPTELILQDVSGQDYVFVADKDKEGKIAARKVPVARGLSYQTHSAIRTGLKGGETIVVDGARKVVDGDAVDVIGNVQPDSTLMKR